MVFNGGKNVFQNLKKASPTNSLSSSGGFEVQANLPFIIGFYLTKMPDVLLTGSRQMFINYVKFLHHFLSFSHEIDTQYQNEITRLYTSIKFHLQKTLPDEMQNKKEELEFEASFLWIGCITRLLKRHRLFPGRNMIGILGSGNEELI